MSYDVHICDIPACGRNGAYWRCEHCTQAWQRVDGRWVFVMHEVAR